MMRVGFILCLFAAAGLATPTTAAEPVSPPLRKVAVIVENRAGKEFNDKVPVLEELLVSRIAGLGFSVLSRDVVTRSLKDYSPGQAAKSGSRLDVALENNTTALRLAQTVGADFILVSSITTFGSERTTFEGNGVKTINLNHTMRVGYKLADAGDGGAVSGDTVTVKKTTRVSAGLQTENTDLVNELLDEAAGLLAQSLIKKQSGLPAGTPKPKAVSFSVACGMTDLGQQPLSIPNVRLGADNKLVVSKDQLEVQALDVTVELNGVVIGTAPGVFQASPGLSKLRLTREGFKPWERTINITEGQSLKVALQLTEAGYGRWKDTTTYLYALDKDRLLTDAEVEVLKGHAQRLRQSGYKVDVKVDTTEGLKIYKSIY
jgi:hypothetical protein